MPARTIKAHFIEPVLLRPTAGLPEAPNWAYELKLDGYRALGIKMDGKPISGRGTTRTSMRGIRPV